MRKNLDTWENAGREKSRKSRRDLSERKKKIKAFSLLQKALIAGGALLTPAQTMSLGKQNDP
jgi:hypothetical protein